MMRNSASTRQPRITGQSFIDPGGETARAPSGASAESTRSAHEYNDLHNDGDETQDDGPEGPGSERGLPGVP